jgi:Zn-dependent M28 family amino/carboxypeptidase
VYLQQFVRAGQAGANVLVEIPGCERPDEDVIAGGHYDHLDSRSDAAGACSARGTPGGAICHGATDNAAGAVVVGIGKALRALPEPSRRSVVLAL